MGGGLNIRQRKLIGTIALLVFLTVYAFLAMLAAIVVTGNKVAELIYFVVAGFAWVFPAGMLVSWMLKPDAEAKTESGQDARS